MQIDDPIYLTNNAHVQKMTWPNVVWSFTTFHDGNWFPLTWLSLMADSDLYGVPSGGFHFTNIALHTLNTLLLFAFLAGPFRPPAALELIPSLTNGQRIIAGPRSPRPSSRKRFAS